MLRAVDYNPLPRQSSVRPSVRFHHSSFQFEARSRLRSGGHLAREGSRLENVIRRRIRGGGRLERTTWSHPRLNCWKCSVCTVDATLGSPDGRAGWGRGGGVGAGEGMQIADRRGYYPRLAETFRAARIIAAKFCQDKGQRAISKGIIY